LQSATDAAATAAATELRLGHNAASATDMARELLDANDWESANVTVNIPPETGPFAGRNGYVEVTTDAPYQSKFMNIIDHVATRTIRSRAVAGADDVTDGAAFVVLDPDPMAVSIPSSDEVMGEIPEEDVSDQFVTGLGLNGLVAGLGLGGNSTQVRNNLTSALSSLVLDAVETALADATSELDLPAAPALTAGFEAEGLGQVRVDGAVLVNNEWGGLDEHGEQVGEESGIGGLYHAVSCMPILPTTQLLARDIRVVGGVDDPNNYRNFDAGGSSPLQANRMPVPDPFQALPSPSASSDDNVSAAMHSPSHAVVVSVGPSSLQGPLQTTVRNSVLGPLGPLLSALLTPIVGPLVDSTVESILTPQSLTPGVYDSITVISVGEVRFEPGVYIIRNTSPLTEMSLCVVGGWIQAEGVLFYITNSAAYDGSTGAPDSSDNAATSPPNPLLSSKPSVLLAPLLPGSSISGLDDAASPFDGMLVYQRRMDRRPIVIGATKLVGGGDISGTIYSKWGHVLFLGGQGTYDVRIVAGTLRVLTVLTSTFAPSQLLPAAQDVLLVE
jgi:hypothetical protein